MEIDELIATLRYCANSDCIYFQQPCKYALKRIGKDVDCDKALLTEAAIKLEALISARKKAMADAGIQKSDVTPKSYITTTDIMPCEPPPPPPKKKKQKGKKKHGKRYH